MSDIENLKQEEIPSTESQFDDIPEDSFDQNTNQDTKENILNSATETEEQHDEGQLEDQQETEEQQDVSIDDGQEQEEEQFEDEEDVSKLKRHKKASSETRDEAKAQVPKEKTRPKKHPLDDQLDGAPTPKRAKSTTGEDEGIEEEAELPAEEDESNLDPETRRKREIQRRIDEALKNPQKRSKKSKDQDLDAFQDEMVNKLREKMRTAALQDAECVNNGQPAINKLKLLPQVTDVIRKGNLADTILDNNLLEAVRVWLEPLPDASLPAYEIQKVLFEALERLPIKTIHLRESGLGKVVLFYQRSKRPQHNIKRIVDKLIGNWTRPIMGRSDNYRDKRIRTRDYRVQDDAAYRRRATGTASSQTAAGGDKDANDIAAANARRKNRAFIPTAKPQFYEVAPKSVVQKTQTSRQTRVANDKSYQRMTQKLMKKRPSGRKSGVSIEGR